MATIIGMTEVIRDGQNTLFMGPTGCGKTRSMLLHALEQFGPTEYVIYVLDPFEEVKLSTRVNIDKLPLKFIEGLIFVTQVEQLPERMSGSILLIDDGRGYYSLIEHSSHFWNKPRHTLSTVQVSRPAVRI